MISPIVRNGWWRSATGRSGSRDGDLASLSPIDTMTWLDTLRTAAEAVRTHRLRSALTMLGILIGITAVVLTVGLGQGARAKVQDQINELGTNILVVSPGSSTSSAGTRGGFGSASTLTEADAAALAVEGVGARHRVGGAGVVVVGVACRTAPTNWTTTLTGTTPSWRAVRSRGCHRAGSSPPPTSRVRRRSWCWDPTPRPSCSAR